jgi:hypothetical protein
LFAILILTRAAKEKKEETKQQIGCTDRFPTAAQKKMDKTGEKKKKG